jgi:hypothetical protein
MGKSLRRPQRIALTLSLALLGILALALPASASAARILYADGHELDPTRLATFGGHTLVDPGNGALPEEGFDGCSDAEWSTALARTDFDLLVVGENAPGCIDGPTDLSPGTLTAIANYVRNGKPIIVLGAHTNEADFLNAVFGFNTTNVSDTSGETLTGTLQPSAAGTPFAGGPPTLTDPSATELLIGTPGTTIYFGPEGVYVFTVPFGAGTVTYLGWDFCCFNADPAGETNADNWYRVLDRATKVSSAFTIDSITRNKKKGTATITVSGQFPGELIASGNGVKASSAGGAVISKAVGAGQSQLLIKAKGKKKKKLKRKGKAKVNVTVTYTPTGGSPKTQSVKLKLKKKLKKKK